MGFVLFIKSCTIIFLIWFLFYLIISQIKYYSEPKKDIFSGGEAGDIIIERSDGTKEEIKEGYSIQGGLWAETPYIETVTGRDENNNVIYSYVREKKNKEEKNMKEIKVGDCELVNKKEKEIFTKEQLKDGDIVILRNGWETVVDIKNRVLLYKDDALMISGYNENLTSKFGHNWDIMKVKRQTLLYNREKQTEMTLEEVCKELGRDIKIVKEH